LLKQRDFWEIYTHRNAIPLHRNNNSGGSSHHHYFDNEPADQLVVIEIASRKRRPESHKPDPALSLCVPAQAFLRCIPSPTPAHAASSPPLIFAWESWGEGHAFLRKRMDMDRRLPQLSRVCGLRTVARKPVLVQQQQRHDGLVPAAASVFRVGDFHPARTVRIAQSRAEGHGPPGVATPVPRHAIVDVPLPDEMQNTDPALISTSICQDALIAFEVRFIGGGTLFFCFVVVLTL
jgi:hypothetical protein